MTITDTMVKYLLPAEINTSEVFTGPLKYSGIGTENNRTMVFFNSSSLSPTSSSTPLSASLTATWQQGQ